MSLTVEVFGDEIAQQPILRPLGQGTVPRLGLPLAVPVDGLLLAADLLAPLAPMHEVADPEDAAALFSPYEAQGTSLVVLIPPIGLFAALEYYRKGYIDFAVVGFICLGFVFGARVASQARR